MLVLTVGCSRGPNTNPGLIVTTSSPVCRPYASAASSERILATGYQLWSTHGSKSTKQILQFVQIKKKQILAVRTLIQKLAVQVTSMLLQNSLSDQQLSSRILPSGQSFGLISTATMDDTTTTRRTFAAEAALSTFVVPVTAGPNICSCTLFMHRICEAVFLIRNG